jgi:hypothetical protein
VRLVAVWFVLLLGTSPASAQEVWRDELQVAEEGTNIPLRETLPNGIKVAVQADPHAAVVVVTTRVRVGWALDPPGLGQLAHIVEHAIFRPSEGEDEGVIEAVARLGGHTNAYTDPDQTVFTTIAPARHLTTVLELEPRRFHRSSALPRRSRSRSGGPRGLDRGLAGRLPRKRRRRRQATDRPQRVRHRGAGRRERAGRAPPTLGVDVRVIGR